MLNLRGGHSVCCRGVKTLVLNGSRIREWKSKYTSLWHGVPLVCVDTASSATERAK